MAQLAKFAILAVALLGAPLATAFAQAGPYREITVQSDIYPSQTISGAVRLGARGEEVRLPGGTWVPCGFNCALTLKNQTIDFWRRYDAFPR
jgi:hypothetical protein